MKQTLLERIQELCKEQGTTLSRLEQELGFSRGALYKWGKSSPSTEKLYMVASYFNVSVDYLMGATADRTPLDELLSATKNKKEGFAIVNFSTGQEHPLSESEYRQILAFLTAIQNQ